MAEVFSYAPGGVLADLYGSYDDRVIEYRFAVVTAFNAGIFGPDLPVLDVGCRNPYEGLLQFLREFGWSDQEASRWLSKPYVGIDIAFDPEVEDQAAEDGYVRLVTADLEAFGFGEIRQKPFVCGFCIEVMEHIAPDCRVALLDEMKRACASIFLTGPNIHFKGLCSDVPGHVGDLSEEMLSGWGFQQTGVVNFSGQEKPGTFYPMENGVSETSSNVWGLWLDEIAWQMKSRTRPVREAILKEDASDASLMQLRGILAKAGHELKVERHGR
jgi:hypothetical protein